MTLADYINSFEIRGVEATTTEDGLTEIRFTHVTQDFSFEVKRRDDIIVYYNNFDVDEEVEMWLEAKRNGLQGVPPVTQLVHEENIIDETLRYLVEKVCILDLKVEIDGEGE